MSYPKTKICIKCKREFLDRTDNHEQEECTPCMLKPAKIFKFHEGNNAEEYDNFPLETLSKIETIKPITKKEPLTMATYEPKPCTAPGCTNEFVPTGARASFCEEHRDKNSHHKKETDGRTSHKKKLIEIPIKKLLEKPVEIIPKIIPVLAPEDYDITITTEELFYKILMLIVPVSITKSGIKITIEKV